MQWFGNIVADSRTSLIFINSLISWRPQLLEAMRAGRHRRKGWAAAGLQCPAYSGRGHIVSPRAQLVTLRVHSRCFLVAFASPL